MTRGIPTPASETAPRAPRVGLSRASAAALVVANMIGAGVFTTSGFALSDLGGRGWVLAAWVAGGALALCGALAYGALGRRFPESGGEYTLLSRSLHPLAGFLAGWVSLLAGFTAPIAAAGRGLQAYLAPWIGETGWSPEWIGSAAIAVAALAHVGRAGVRLQNAAVLVKLLAITAFAALGAWSFATRGVAPAEAPAAPFEAGAFAVTLVWISFSYSGWNASTYVASELRDPGRDLAPSLWGACAVVTLGYLALNAVFLFAAPVAALSGREDVGAAAARALGGEPLAAALSGLVALALFTSISAMVMAGPRVYARMAQDGLFPRWFEARGNVPRAAVLLQAGLAIAVVWFSELVQLLGYIGFTLGLSSAATVVGLLRVRAREGAERVPAFGYPWVPLAYVAATLGAAGFLVARRPVEAAWGLATMLLGVPLYAWWSRGRRGPARSGG